MKYIYIMIYLQARMRAWINIESVKIHTFIVFNNKTNTEYTSFTFRASFDRPISNSIKIVQLWEGMPLCK